MSGGDDSRNSMDDVLASIRKIMQGGEADLSGVPGAGSKAAGGAVPPRDDEYALPPGAVSTEEKELAERIAARSAPADPASEAPAGDVSDGGAADLGDAHDITGGNSLAARTDEADRDGDEDEPALELSDLIAAPAADGEQSGAEPEPEPAPRQPRLLGFAGRLAEAASRVFSGRSAPPEQDTEDTTADGLEDDDDDVLTLGPAMQAPETPAEAPFTEPLSDADAHAEASGEEVLGDTAGEPDTDPAEVIAAHLAGVGADAYAAGPDSGQTAADGAVPDRNIARDADDPFAGFMRRDREDEDDIAPPPPRGTQTGAATFLGQFAQRARWPQDHEPDVEDAETADSALEGPESGADARDGSGETGADAAKVEADEDATADRADAGDGAVADDAVEAAAMGGGEDLPAGSAIEEAMEAAAESDGASDAGSAATGPTLAAVSAAATAPEAEAAQSDGDGAEAEAADAPDAGAEDAESGPRDAAQPDTADTATGEGAAEEADAGATAEEADETERASEDPAAPRAAPDLGDLEPAIRRIIREELEGEIGASLSQSIRRLIRKEIARANLRSG